MRKDPEEYRRRLREYTAMIRRNNPEEIAEYKRKREEQKAANKAKYADKEWRNAYHNARRASFPSEIKRKEAALAKKSEKEKLKALKLEEKEKLKALNLEEKELFAEQQLKLEKLKYFFRVKSNRLAKKLFGNYSKNFQIHHCFGFLPNSFVILCIEDHIELHKRFGKSNNECLFNNEHVADYIMNVPHCIIRNGVIASNNLQNYILTMVK